MSGLYPPSGDHLLVVRIRDNAACVILSYLEIDGGTVDEAVNDLLELGEFALEARRAAESHLPPGRTED
ncbi:hypothetical protein ACIBCN_44280 [Nocardia sp. NPDC051052]|uniref:hypothetical protein n=1 Tax=Nocardia sp. NPDC051052 TaxID=3364322 RepID=UPI003798CAA6